eukprot:GHVU01202620.1.p1 GENE.GHVU01202620.1~~GHVU01202620.1.p1  ORF type:complete len:127 (-),score=12.57 GHVU01202620.1:409-789(-)
MHAYVCVPGVGVVGSSRNADLQLYICVCVCVAYLICDAFPSLSLSLSRPIYTFLYLSIYISLVYQAMKGQLLQLAAGERVLQADHIVLGLDQDERKRHRAATALNHYRLLMKQMEAYDDTKYLLPN